MRTRSTLPLLLILAGVGCAEREREDPGPRVKKERVAPEPAEPKEEPPELAFVVRSASDGPIRVRTGQKFGVSLMENASIGYQWSTLSVPDTLRALGSVGVSSGEYPPAAGASHGVIFRFEAVKAGPGQLRFQREYRGDPDEQLTFEVIAE